MRRLALTFALALAAVTASAAYATTYGWDGKTGQGGSVSFARSDARVQFINARIYISCSANNRPAKRVGVRALSFVGMKITHGRGHATMGLIGEQVTGTASFAGTFAARAAQGTIKWRLKPNESTVECTQLTGSTTWTAKRGKKETFSPTTRG